MARSSAREKLSPQRESLYRAIKKEPGITISQLADQLDVGWSALYYHLGRLHADKLIESRRIGKNRLVYPKAMKGKKPRPLVLGNTARSIALAVIRRPGCSMSDLLRDLEFTPRSLYYNVDRLASQGLIKSGSPTRYVDLKPTPRLFEGLGLSARSGRRRR